MQRISGKDVTTLCGHGMGEAVVNPTPPRQRLGLARAAPQM